MSVALVFHKSHCSIGAFKSGSSIKAYTEDIYAFYLGALNARVLQFVARGLFGSSGMAFLARLSALGRMANVAGLINTTSECLSNCGNYSQ